MYCRKCDADRGPQRVCVKCGSATLYEVSWFFVLAPLLVWPVLLSAVWSALVALVDGGLAAYKAPVLGVALALGLVSSVVLLRLKRRIESLRRVPGRRFGPGDRVRVSRFAMVAHPRDTGLAEPVILDDAEPIRGTVLEVQAGQENRPLVKWDAGYYRVHKETTVGADGRTYFLDRGRMLATSFRLRVPEDALVLDARPNGAADAHRLSLR